MVVFSLPLIKNNSMHHQVVIVAAKRTPIGSFLGSLSTIPAPVLGGKAIAAALASAQIDPAHVEEVYMGHVLQVGTGQAPARQAALEAGISDNVPCTTVNKVCASGMKSIMLAAQAIRLGDAEIVVAGGMENMSLSPHFSCLRTGQKFGPTTLTDAMQHDGLTDAYSHQAMGVFADATAETHKISRESQDAFAIASYQKSQAAWEAGHFDAEVCPIEVPKRKGAPVLIDRDEECFNFFPEKIPALRPAFTSDGTVTAANASTLNDGAAAVVLMSATKAQSMGLKPLATVLSAADAAQAPQWFTTAPAKAIPKALALANLSLEQIDLIEINEAFSVVGLANIDLLGLAPDKVNQNGGAVALGHPLGCSGTRIVVTLLHQLQKKGRFGMAGICNGGGGASAMVFEKK